MHFEILSEIVRNLPKKRPNISRPIISRPKFLRPKFLVINVFTYFAEEVPLLYGLLF